MTKLAEMFTTVFYVGKIPFAPGTMGSLVAFLFVPFLIDLNISIAIMIGLSLIGLISIHFHTKSMLDYEDKDLKEIVIDEVIGQFLTFFIITRAEGIQERLTKMIIEIKPDIFLISIFIVSFLTFRFFDIYKPLFIRHIDEKMNNAWGIILDDIAAGIMASILTLIIFSVTLALFLIVF